MSEENGPIEGFAEIVVEGMPAGMMSPGRPHAPSRAAPKLPGHAPPRPPGATSPSSASTPMSPLASPPPLGTPITIAATAAAAAPMATSINSRDPVQMQALRDALAKAEAMVKAAKQAKIEAERLADQQRRERQQVWETKMTAQREKMEAMAAVEETKRVASESMRSRLDEIARAAIERATASRAALKASTVVMTAHEKEMAEEVARLDREKQFLAQGMTGAEAARAAAALSLASKPGAASMSMSLTASGSGGPLSAPATGGPPTASVFATAAAAPSTSQSGPVPTRRISGDHVPPKSSTPPRRSSGSSAGGTHKHSGSGGTSGAMTINVPASPSHASTGLSQPSPGGGRLKAARPAALTSLSEGGIEPTDDNAPSTPRDFSSEKCLKDGYLYKLGGQVKNWKRRYFRLVGTFLVYFKHKEWKNLDPLGMINVKGAKIVTFAPGVYDRDHLFGIAPVKTKRTYVLGGKSDDERAEWLDMFDSVIGPRPVDDKKKMRGGGDKHNPLIKEGFLRQWANNEWMEYFFILTAASLKAYAETYAGPKQVDDVPLQKGTVVQMEPAGHEQDCCFSLVPFGRPKMMLACIDEAVRGNWMEAFNDALHISSDHSRAGDRRGSLRIAPYSDRYEYSESDSEKAEDMSLDSSDEEHPEDISSPLRVHAANDGSEMSSPTNTTSSLSMGGVGTSSESDGAAAVPIRAGGSFSGARASPLVSASPRGAHPPSLNLASMSSSASSVSATPTSHSQNSIATNLGLGEPAKRPGQQQQHAHDHDKHVHDDDLKTYPAGTVRRGSRTRANIYKGDDICFKEGGVGKLNSKFEIGAHKKPKKIPEKEWDRVHLKLTGFLLTTHAAKRDPKVMQEIHLISTCAVAEPDLGRYCFSVLQTTGPKKFHLFMANSEDERNEWIQLCRDRHRFGNGDLPRHLTIETHPNVVMLMNPDEKALREVAVKNAASGKQLCQNCEKNAASSFCSDCKQYMCEDCDSVMHLHDKKKDHNRQPLHALNAGVSEAYVIKSNKSKGIKAAVSKKKRRFVMDGFDLDLSYITDKLIAMGFPAEGTEALYRNDMTEVQRFFENRHRDHYMVYNLCAERKFDPDKFHNRVLQFPFDDHNCPSFEDMMFFCKHLAEYLAIHRKNVAAIHCKAGKGRTGLMITVFLLYIGEWQTADEALRYYGFARTLNQKGVTIPSQRRWVQYFQQYMDLSKQGLSLPVPQKLVISKILLSATAPEFNFVSVNCHGLSATSKEAHAKIARTKSGATEAILGEPFVVMTDFEVAFYKGKALGGKKRAFSVWLHTQFLDNGYVKLTRTEIDKVSKMKGIPDFTLEMFFAPLPVEHAPKYIFGFEPITLTTSHIALPAAASSVFQ